MGDILRVQFGQLCFNDCGNTVPMARVRILQHDAATQGRNLLKSEIIWSMPQ